MRGYLTEIGSRDTPQEVLEVMTSLAKAYTSAGWILRSGGAVGADTAFEEGAGDAKEISYANIHEYVSTTVYAKAQNIASHVHPVWSQLSDMAKKYHTRNVFQVLGKNLDKPSLLLICWTGDKCISYETRTRDTGGTGTAIGIASLAKIPIINLARPDHLWRANLIIGR